MVNNVSVVQCRLSDVVMRQCKGFCTEFNLQHSTNLTMSDFIRLCIQNFLSMSDEDQNVSALSNLVWIV